MDIKDIRIGDVLATKSMAKDSLDSPRVETIDGLYNMITLRLDEYSSFEVRVNDIEYVNASKNTLENVGVIFEFMSQSAILQLDKMQFVISKHEYKDCYVATSKYEKKNKSINFTYIHELQHWLWDEYRLTI